MFSNYFNAVRLTAQRLDDIIRKVCISNRARQCNDTLVTCDVRHIDDIISVDISTDLTIILDVFLDYLCLHSNKRVALKNVIDTRRHEYCRLIPSRHVVFVITSEIVIFNDVSTVYLIQIRI